MKKISTSILSLICLSLLAANAVKAASDEMVLPVFSDIKGSNSSKEGALINEYGQNEFERCRSANCKLLDANNPFAYSACLFLSELCLDDNLDAPDSNCAESFTFSNGRCVSYDLACREQFGEHSRFSGIVDGDFYECSCAAYFAEENGRCVSSCEEEKINYTSGRQVNGDFIDTYNCLDKSQACQEEFGESAVYSRTDESGDTFCACASGYEWNETKSECVEGVAVLGYESPLLLDEVYYSTLEREASLTWPISSKLSTLLSGRILLQVEEAGEAWYVNPDDTRKYFLGSPASAFEVMRELGLGASHEFIDSYEFYPEHVLGRILIDVDDAGRAYYINKPDRKAYYLGRPGDAFNVMRRLGLGASNDDLRQIAIGEVGKNYCTQESRSETACTEDAEAVCGWFNTSAIHCESYPCAANYSNSCEACKDDIVDYWESGKCPK